MHYTKFGWCGIGWFREEPSLLLKVPAEKAINIISQNDIHCLLAKINYQLKLFKNIDKQPFFQPMLNIPSFNFEPAFPKRIVSSIASNFF